MGLLEKLERIFLKPKPGTEKAETPKQERVAVKEIFCKRKDDDYIQSLTTPVKGTEYRNPDGSDRQKALAKLKEGDPLRMIWDTDKNHIYLVRKVGLGSDVKMAECFGLLNEKVTADVIRWLNQDNIVTAARVSKITESGTKKQKLGCVVELRTYPGPEEKK